MSNILESARDIGQEFYTKAETDTGLDLKADITYVDSELANIDLSDYVDKTTNQTITGIKTFRSADAIESTSGNQATLEVYQDTVNADAFMQFHVGGDYAAYFGLDGSTNDFAVGGWSMGANKYKVWHAGNDGNGSGLDADLLDGQQGSYYLPVNSYTASDVLAKIKTVDGSGSGLDADLLDGLQLHTGRNNQANKVVRTNSSGYIDAGWINTTSGNTTNTITDFYVNTNDGYIRKATKSHVISQLGALTDAGKSFSTNGYQKLSNGLIIQWGQKATGISSFPITFPTACLQAVASQANYYGSAANVVVSGFSTSSLSLSGEASVTYRYIAIGY